MPQADLALILDIETTGNRDESELIEIGMVMLAVPSLNEIGRLNVIVEPSPEQFSAMMANDVVRAMHEKNGLIADIVAGKGLSKEQADLTINRWLDQFTDSPRTHIPYGGSGVSHFDRKYIDWYLPRLGRRLTYWALDVGSVRRIFALQGGSWLKIDGGEAYDAKTHRAIDDAVVHAEELRFAAKSAEYADRYRDLQSS